jgi:selenocysteine lyase/cysteine desulfurase
MLLCNGMPLVSCYALSDILTGTMYCVCRYLRETEWREESGTPAIVESIRCGLVFQLKEAVGVSYIHEQ